MYTSEKRMSGFLIRVNIIILVLSNFVNFSNYLLQLVLGRYLTPEDFGIYNSVVSLGVILASLGQVLPNVATKFIVKYSSNQDQTIALVKGLNKVVLIYGGLISVLFVALSGIMSSYLNLSSSTPVIIFVVSLYTFYWLSCYIGILNGLSKYVLVNRQMVAHAILRLVLTLVCVAVLGLSYNSVLAIPVICNLVVFWWIINRGKTDEAGNS